MQHSKNVYPIERILSALTYFTVGGVGFIWLIIATIFKKNVTQFLRYHIFQSIFISITYYLISVLANLLYVILYKIPIINAIPFFLNAPIPVFFGLSIIQCITTSIILYLAITSFMGMYSYLPWVSDIIKGNTER